MPGRDEKYSADGADHAGKTGTTGDADHAGKTGTTGGADHAGKTGTTGGADHAGKAGTGGVDHAGKADNAGQRSKNHAGCAIVILASGYGKRFGRNKLTASFEGEPLFVRALKLAEGSKAAQVILVTRYEEIREYAGNYFPACKIIWNEHPERGISESIRLGISELMQEDTYKKCTGCCFMVCDQPLLKQESLDRLLNNFADNPECIHMCAAGEQTGNPAVFPEKLFKELLLLKGDRGGKKVACRHPELVRKVFVQPQELSDVDCIEDLIKLENTHE